MRTVEEFTPLPDFPNCWTDTSDMLYVGRVGQSIESFVEELNDPREPTIPVPDAVSRRQFKLQLEISGLTAPVSAWVAAQSTLIQIAFAESGSFLRSDPMLQQGFVGLGFTEQQIDEFFIAAGNL